MTYQEINAKLLIEYEAYYSFLINNFDTELKASLSLPILMHVYPDYDLVCRKIMIVGQETKNWFDTLSNTDINVNDIIDFYREFELGKDYYNSPFWRFSKRIFQKLNPGLNFKGSLWTNLSKVDQEGKSVNQFVRTKNKMGYDLLVKEIEITRPDIVIFLTSWKEDETLKNLFNKLTLVRVEGIPFEYLVKLESPFLPQDAFRTYHPRFLNDGNRSKFTIDEMIENIVNNLTDVPLNN